MSTKYIKTLYSCSVTTLLIILYVTLKNTVVNNTRRRIDETLYGDTTEMKYILQWTSPENEPIKYLGKGQKGFIERNCPHANCFLTANKSYMGDYTKFHGIVFAGPEVAQTLQSDLPRERSPNQKYVFATIESSANYPLCSTIFNEGFFNWTWTYRLDSDVRWGYIVIRDMHKNIIGPNKEMHWLKSEDMNPVSDKLKEQLKSKRKAAAWFVSNCRTKSEREKFGYALKKVLLLKYNQVLDIYGQCGLMVCPRDSEDKCNKMIQNTYYFYLSFENSFSEDYVTEKLLYPLQNNAVPIVFGGANYTRFMPDGIYLNARELGVEKLAAKINELIHDPNAYAEYFRWKNHYTYHKTSESVETDEYCRLCSLLNEVNATRKTTIYYNFQEWWDPPKLCEVKK